MTDVRRYILAETGVSMVINAVLSAAFTGLIFSGRSIVAPAGPGGFAADFLVQSFIVILMSVVAPSLITRARLKAGKLAFADGANAARVWPRAVLAAGVGAVLLGGAAAGLSLLAGPQPLALVLVVKTVWGAALAAAFTPWALRAVLRTADISAA